MSEALRAEPQDSWNTLVSAREVGDSRFIICDWRRLRYRTLRALESHNRHQPGVLLAKPRSPQALRYRRAPRAKANPTDDELDQTFLY